MKIIFLDIDGVMNCRATIVRADRITADGTSDGWHEQHIDPEMTARLNTLIERTEAKIVISSSWRALYSTRQIREILHRRGFKYPEVIIDSTPRFREGERGDEIEAWMNGMYGRVCMGDRSALVDQIVILDDDSDMASLRSYLIQTSFETGLQDHHVEAACAILWSET